MIVNQNMKINNNQLRNGVSGIMRVKNDAEFIEASIDSCIDALDELVIVYNDCSDNSPELIYKKQMQYPDKIKVYEYKHKIYSINLTKEEYEYAKSLPSDSPHLLCNYYNFALSKVTCQYAMKIDADQIYFSDKLKEWCDAYRNVGYVQFSFKTLLGCGAWLLFYMMLLYTRKTNKLSNIFSRKILEKIRPYYDVFVSFLVKKYEIPCVMSGMNIFKDKNDEWYVSLGKINDIINILPPYNGAGDHMIFKVTDEVYYKPYDCPSYNVQRSDSYTYIEQFVQPKKTFYIGAMWFHVNAMRKNCRDKVSLAKKKYSFSFMPIKSFLKSNFVFDIIPKMKDNFVNGDMKALFCFLHQTETDEIEKNMYLLSSIN